MARTLLLVTDMPAPQQMSSVRSERTAVREPDGVPHEVVGLSALFSVLFAAVVLGMWLSGSTGRIAAVAICMVGVPMLVSGLRSRADGLRARADRVRRLH